MTLNDIHQARLSQLVGKTSQPPLNVMDEEGRKNLEAYQHRYDARLGVSTCVRSPWRQNNDR